MSSTSTSILVIGAGPAGLALGHELNRHGLEYLILEKSEEVGNTFASMTESTTYGPWLNNLLPGSRVPLHRLVQRTTRAEYSEYLRDYRREHGINVLTGSPVLSVVRQPEGGYRVETPNTVIDCQILVNATGYYSNPNWPDHPGRSESRIPCLHSADYRDPNTILHLTGRTRAKVLIVGARLSAGEIMEELHRAGHEVHLSHRSRIETWPSPLEEALISPLMAVWEWLALKLGGSRPSNLVPRLRRGYQLRLIQRGEVPTHPDVIGFDGPEVEFQNGRREEFDLVLYATGYQAALGHLESLLGDRLPELDGLAAVDHEGLYFLGMIDSRTFRSQFLRGIRDDAVLLGEILEDRLRTGVAYRPKPAAAGLPNPGTRPATKSAW